VEGNQPLSPVEAFALALVEASSRLGAAVAPAPVTDADPRPFDAARDDTVA